jgi:hypothetical protein
MNVSLSKSYALVFGAVYTLVGILGFFVSTTLASANLIIFPVNVVHNIAHLALIGIPGLVAYFVGRTVEYARVMTVLFAVLVVAGLLPQPFLGIIPLGGWDIALHALSGVAALVAGWLGYRAAQRRTA